MREILFKAICKDSGKWIEGDLITMHYPKSLCIATEGTNQNWSKTKFTKVDPETVCQFTGLYDSTKWQDLTESEREQWTRSGSMPSEWNGKRIFEGDKFYLGDPNILYVVDWHDSGFKGKQIGSSSYVGLEYWRYKIVIIGNIHDRKEGV